MPFQKGQVSNPKGRPKGKPNATTKQVVEQILGALKDKGGQAWLKRLDDKTFAMLVARVVPRDLNITGDVTLTLGDMLSRLRESAKEGNR